MGAALRRALMCRASVHKSCLFCIEPGNAVIRSVAISVSAIIGFSVTLSASVVGAGTALAEVAPKLDVKATCQRAEPLSGAAKSAYQSCLSDEMDAQKELAKTWSSFKAGARST